MENNRPKIASLPEKELATLLIESFFKVGKQVKLSSGETKILIGEVYKKHGWIYADTFGDAFSGYAALELPDMENHKPSVSPLFINWLIKSYLAKCNSDKHSTAQVKKQAFVLTPELKYRLFIKHILFYNCLPGNPDWVMIYEHIAGLKKLTKPEGWDALLYGHKWKYAMNEVTEWAHKNCELC